MAVPKSTIWECAPHTKAKHLLLEKYLKAWFPILGRYHSRIIYLDGFAGPGEYSKGEKGSPLVALEVAKNHSADFIGELRFYFVENEVKRYNHLKSIVDQQTYPKNFIIEMEQGEFAEILKKDLDAFDQSGNKNAPIFAFIDPFGFSGVPYELLARLLKMERTEVFVYFARESVNRFLEQESVAHHMKELFGLDSIDVLKGPDHITQIKNLYESQLKRAAQFVGSFTMINEKGVPLYDLFFASNNVKGYVKMKEAMWSVDDSGGFRFSDKDNQHQVELFRPDPAGELMKMMSNKKADNVNIDRLEAYVEGKTIYLAKHLKAALKQMEIDGSINVHTLKHDGSSRRKGRFAPGTVMDFI